ncbi:MAG: hypothetical protein WBW88_19690, partial [Rhodothermales bacterium]
MADGKWEMKKSEMSIVGACQAERGVPARRNTRRRIKHTCVHARVLLAPVFALGVSTAFAQPADTTNYFPLEIGNSWTYYGLVERHDAPPDTGIGLPKTIGEMLSVHDTTYYRAPHPNGFADTLRDDGEGRIWARVRGKDVLLYDFLLPEGETYSFDFFNDPDPRLLYYVTAERHVTIDVAAGHFENCVRLYFDVPEGADFGHTYIFAPNVGIATSYDGMGDGSYLYEAVVDGKLIASTEDDNPTSRREVDAYAYPDPFASVTTVILPVKIGSAPTAVVYDILGRKVASLTATRCEPRQCTYRWHGS